MSIASDVLAPNIVPTSTNTSEGLRVGVIGAGLAGLVTAMELVDAGHTVEIFDTRPFVGGKVGSWVDRDGNHIEMGLHVFFGCYYNLFEVMEKIGAYGNLRRKEHRHQFINDGGKLGELDFRLGGIGAPWNGLKAFFTTWQLGIGDKMANALALGTSMIVRGLVDFDGAMRIIRELDCMSFSEWFQSKGGSRGSIERLWNPIAFALGFIDCDHISARCMLTIFQLFAARTEASVLRMLEGSPNEYLTGPLVSYIEARGGRINLRKRIRSLDYTRDEQTGKFKVNGFHVGTGPGTSELFKADAVVAACDVPGIQRLLPPEFREIPEMDNIYKLDAVPVVTVQLRFNGWVTELEDEEHMRDLSQAHGLDNLLYTSDASFSCFADLALTSPADYYRAGQGSLVQLVLTPGDKWIPKTKDEIVATALEELRKLFPSARELDCQWSSVVKLAESLYREKPGMDKYRPRQQTDVEGLFLAGSYTYQDYIDSMEGAVKSGRQAATAVINSVKSVAV